MKKLIFFILAFFLIIPFVNADCDTECRNRPEGYASGRCSKIFFQYGAEIGDLPGSWDVAGFHYGYDPDAYVAVVPDSPLGYTVPVRSGSKSVEIYKPTSTTEYYSLGLQKWDTAKELYLSRWIYFPDIAPWNSRDKQQGQRHSFGGFILQSGPESNPGKYFLGLNIAQTSYGLPDYSNANKFWVSIRWGETTGTGDLHYLDSEEDFTEFKNSGLYISDYVGVWTHIQMGLKIASDNTGWGRIWLNKEGEPSTLIYEKTGIKTDPEAYSQWTTKAGYYLRSDTPSAYFGLHKSLNNPETWIFLDDIVMSTEKVPEYYGVDDSAGLCAPDEVPITTGCPSGQTCCCSEEPPIPIQCQTLLDMIISSYGKRCRQSGYDKYADVNKDRKVDITDLGLVNMNFGDEVWCENRLNDHRNPCRRGGGCPILKVFDGKEFVTVEKLDIHAPKDQDVTVTSTFTMKPINGKYELILDEAAYLFWDGSHIDSVQLTTEEGECQLISAMHSKQGDVLQALAESDDVRVRTFPGERIKLVYDGCSGKEFTFSIEGYNMKILGFVIPDFLIVLLAIIILFVIFAVMKFKVKK